ncbi:predicted protein [Lichtheimia corymbifera JMRC:FSU:9682]|uniref:Uncharacterized protein n=1 Tax=Lichtheimia corymbifera JMRC:FSU:9682 TaxID=1263082 RepID=A0A068RL90_9FUNG|nr:predicted protein [Lichtheimia corymbifera JMRC:FSU:9682]
MVVRIEDIYRLKIRDVLKDGFEKFDLQEETVSTNLTPQQKYAARMKEVAVFIISVAPRYIVLLMMRKPSLPEVLRVGVGYLHDTLLLLFRINEILLRSYTRLRKQITQKESKNARLREEITQKDNEIARLRRLLRVLGKETKKEYIPARYIPP